MNLMINNFIVLGKEIFLNLENGFCSFSSEEILDSLLVKKPELSDYNFPMYKTVTFCLEHTCSCNLNCNYCFNKNKYSKYTIFDIGYKNLLDNLFRTFKECDKYFIDLSSDAEPLTNIDFIKDLLCYVDIKQEEIRREINVSFVTNGTLLNEKVVNFLQNNGVIFGISLDGDKNTHDKHRRFLNGSPTYNLIMKNVKLIKNKEFLGVAVTLTNSIFDLTKTIINLNKYFSTISIKFARLEKECFDNGTINYWISEFEKLTLFLLDEVVKDKYNILFALLNGDDLFGRYLSLAILNSIPFNRCDAGNGRIFVDIDKNYYPCVPLKYYSKYKLQFINETLNTNELYEIFDKTKPNLVCNSCVFKNLCGGECLVEYEINNGNNKMKCKLKQHLILLSKYFYLRIKDNKYVYNKILKFVINKLNLKRTDCRYKEIVNNNPHLSFKKCKEIYYKEINIDNNQQLYGD